MSGNTYINQQQKPLRKQGLLFYTAIQNGGVCAS